MLRWWKRIKKRVGKLEDKVWRLERHTGADATYGALPTLRRDLESLRDEVTWHREQLAAVRDYLNIGLIRVEEQPAYLKAYPRDAEKQKDGE